MRILTFLVPWIRRAKKDNRSNCTPILFKLGCRFPGSGYESYDLQPAFPKPECLVRLRFQKSVKSPLGLQKIVQAVPPRIRTVTGTRTNYHNVLLIGHSPELNGIMQDITTTLLLGVGWSYRGGDLGCRGASN
jgi:hypothetical protein